MTIQVFGGNVDDGYAITRSLRLRADNSAYLNRTFATNSNASFTLSLWMKRGVLSALQAILGVDAGNYIQLTATDEIKLFAGSTTSRATSTALFRDPSAWYHVVIVRNGGQGGTTSAWTIYVNNQSVLTYTGNGGTFNSNVAHYLGTKVATSDFFDGYLAEINYVDGQALTPSSFGSTDPTTGVWEPIQYAGTYGANGFYLQFNDNNAATAAAIGKDTSGNGNNWTPNGISVAAGINEDSMLDSPMMGGAGVRPSGNYCVLNALSLNNTATLRAGNLATTAATTHAVIGSIGMDSGKWYWEIGYSSAQGGQAVGVFGTTANMLSITPTVSRIGIRFDRDAGTLDYTIDGTNYTSIATGLTATTYFPYAEGTQSSKSINANFGQRTFTYTPPSGYVALCSTNLPDSTIKKGEQYMDATTYTGTNASLSVVNDAGFSPDLVWIKNRNTAAYDNVLFDAIRGATKYLSSDTTSGETTNALTLTAFNSNGFTVNSDQTTGKSAINYVAWQWDAGSSTLSNTNGSITSQVRANPNNGVSVVTYTGVASGTVSTVGHGLGVAPSMIIAKNRAVSSSWYVYHKSLGAAARIQLETTAALTSGSTVWGSTPPTDSVFSVSNNNNLANPMVAYCFAEVAGFSKFGTYVGNKSTDGAFVYTGFRPKFIMVKCSSSLGPWVMLDTSRSPVNTVANYTYANSTAIEASDSAIDFLANGFKIRSANVDVNQTSATFIYMAFAENPFKNALAR